MKSVFQEKQDLFVVTPPAGSEVLNVYREAAMIALVPEKSVRIDDTDCQGVFPLEF
jgi:hypothetical protein